MLLQQGHKVIVIGKDGSLIGLGGLIVCTAVGKANLASAGIEIDLLYLVAVDHVEKLAVRHVLYLLVLVHRQGLVDREHYRDGNDYIEKHRAAALLVIHVHTGYSLDECTYEFYTTRKPLRGVPA